MINVTSVMKYTGALLASMLLLGSSAATVQAPEVLVQETTDKITSILRRARQD